jgi:hypothetical protein
MQVVRPAPASAAAVRGRAAWHHRRTHVNLDNEPTLSPGFFVPSRPDLDIVAATAVTRQCCGDYTLRSQARGHLHSSRICRVVQEFARKRVAKPWHERPHELEESGPSTAMDPSASEGGFEVAAGGTSDLDVWSNSDADSSYGDLASETASLTSSILNGHFENGRRYHAYQKASGEYILPDDEQEQDRLDIKYASIQLLFSDTVTFAPLQNPQQILDIGTGTGIWAIDAGEQFPSATVTATDLSPIQPTWYVFASCPLRLRFASGHQPPSLPDVISVIQVVHQHTRTLIASASVASCRPHN